MKQRNAWLWDNLLEGRFTVTFEETNGITTSQSTMSFLTQHDALLEIGLFKYRDIWESLASR